DTHPVDDVAIPCLGCGNVSVDILAEPATAIEADDVGVRIIGADRGAVGQTQADKDDAGYQRQPVADPAHHGATPPNLVIRSSLRSILSSICCMASNRASSLTILAACSEPVLVEDSRAVMRSS